VRRRVGDTRDLSPADEVYGQLGERELTKELNDKANEPELPSDAKDSTKDGSDSGSESAQAGSAADSGLPSYADEMYRTTDDAAQERVQDQYDNRNFRM
jgi:hypothetical protein